MVHYHIRWSGGKLDWQAFDTAPEAETCARHLKRPKETYIIEEFNGTGLECQVAGLAQLAKRLSHETDYRAEGWVASLKRILSACRPNSR